MEFEMESDVSEVSRLIDALDLDSLRAELDRLNARARQVRSLIAAREAYEAATLHAPAGANFDPTCRYVPRQSSSIRDMVVQILGEANRPMTAIEIRDEVKARFGRLVVRTSMSPILSKLAQAGVITKDDVGWSLTSK